MQGDVNLCYWRSLTQTIDHSGLAGPTHLPPTDNKRADSHSLLIAEKADIDNQGKDDVDEEEEEPWKIRRPQQNKDHHVEESQGHSGRTETDQSRF